MPKFADHIKGATVHRPTVPAPLAALLASADLTAPLAGAKLDLDRLDAKLAAKGLNIGQRLTLKAAMRQGGMLG
jgi:hypothetical protein